MTGTFSATVEGYTATLTIISDSEDEFQDSRAIGMVVEEEDDRPVNYAALAGISDEDLTPILSELAIKMATQRYMVSQLTLTEWNGAATVDEVEYTATLVVDSALANTDGLSASCTYVEQSQPVNINLGVTAWDPTPTASDALAYAQGLLQGQADGLALASANS